MSDATAALNGRKAALHTAAFIVIYLSSVSALTLATHGGRSWLHRLVPYSNEAGAGGYTLERLREAGSSGPVDILFMGSAHAYRSFDVRVFRDSGIRAFNLGTVAQTPLNSYYLYDAYHEKFRPKRVVLECYPPMMQSEDGLESFYDLVVNMPLKPALWKMALATHSPQAVHLILSELVSRRFEPLERKKQSPEAGHGYIPGGTVEVRRQWDPAERFRTGSLKLSAYQLDYLDRLIRLARSRGAQVTVITQPLPESFLLSLTNYPQSLRRIREVSVNAGADFLDGNSHAAGWGITAADFSDAHNLNADGARKASRGLLRIISNNRTGSGL